MTETERRRTYYRPRVMVRVESVLNPTSDGILVCLQPEHLALLRPIVQYLHRKATYASTYDDDYYLVPTDAEWDEISSIVAELEDLLMGTCDDLVSAMEDLVVQLSCVCEGVSNLGAINGLLPGMIPDSQPGLDDYDSPVIPYTGSPPSGFGDWDEWDIQVCKSAQKTIDDAIEGMERLATAIGAGQVITVALVQASLAGLVVFPPLALVTLIATALAGIALINIQAEGRGWLAAHKQAIVCEIFNSDSSAGAKAAVDAYIDANWDVSGSPQFIKLVLSHRVFADIFDGTMPDYDTWESDYSENYCSGCGIIEGTDWFAVPINVDLAMSCAQGEGWNWYCTEGEAIDGEKIVGFLVQVHSKTSGMTLNWMQEGYGSCTGTPLPLNSGVNLEGGSDYYCYKTLTHDADDVIATLLPGAAKYNELTPLTGPGTWEINFKFGYNVAGTANVTVTHIVYEGTLG